MAHINLKDVHNGQRGKIISVDAQGEINQRIRDMGLIPGTTLSVIGRAPLGDPMAVRLSGVTISLRGSEAGRISIELIR